MKSRCWGRSGTQMFCSCTKSLSLRRISISFWSIWMERSSLTKSRREDSIGSKMPPPFSSAFLMRWWCCTLTRSFIGTSSLKTSFLGRINLIRWLLLTLDSLQLVKMDHSSRDVDHQGMWHQKSWIILGMGVKSIFSVLESSCIFYWQASSCLMRVTTTKFSGRTSIVKCSSHLDSGSSSLPKRRTFAPNYCKSTPKIVCQLWRLSTMNGFKSMVVGKKSKWCSQ